MSSGTGRPHSYLNPIPNALGKFFRGKIWPLCQRLNWRGVVLILGLGATLAFGAWVEWPRHWNYDIHKVHPALQALVRPYQSVVVTYHRDGGTVGLRLTDRDGRLLQLAVPISTIPGKADYSQLFLGTNHPNKRGSKEAPYSEDTRKMIITIIDENAKPGFDRDRALLRLRGAPEDYFHEYGEAAAAMCQSLAGR